eukprot:gene8155-8348_t
MGRVVRSERLKLGSGSRQRLVILAAAQQLSISPEDMEMRLQELVTLLPDLSSMLPALHPRTLANLAADTPGVAQKLIRLRLLFPVADLAQMISRRPTLLLEEEFQQIEPARVKLLLRLAPNPGSPADAAAVASPPANVLGTRMTAPSTSASSTTSADAGRASLLDGLVSRQPLLLVENVDQLLDELERLLPAVDVMSAVLHDPDIIVQVMSNRKLSLW